MKLFHHGDLDGLCCGFWVNLNVGITPYHNGSIKSEAFEINYNQQFPLDRIIPNEQVWIVDFSIAPEEMLSLLKITKDVTWSDQHKTASEKY